ncbi:CorA metal ion transporter [Mortierella sp. GBA30]|nr:CorA metal ion transporter [Mortierella sp. GBA30]
MSMPTEGQGQGHMEQNGPGANNTSTFTPLGNLRQSLVTDNNSIVNDIAATGQSPAGSQTSRSGYSAPGYPAHQFSQSTSTTPATTAATAGPSAGYSPTLQSEHASTAPQTMSSAHYTANFSSVPRRLDYSSRPGSYRGSEGGGSGSHHVHYTPQQHIPHQHTQSQYHHRHLHPTELEHKPGVNVMVIDYEGLDACVQDASVNESNGYQDSITMIEEDYKKQLHDTDQIQDQHQSQSHISDDGGLTRAFSTGSASVFGSAFRRRSARKASFYSERAPRPPLPEQLRYTFYSRTTGLIQAISMPQILEQASLQSDPGSEWPTSFSDLLKDGCFWIDILDPSDFDMHVLAKYFHIHPLTIEDISTEEVREKYEVFRNYYFVCFRTFDQDYNSGSYLQPASMYSVVLREGIITCHFRPANHHLNVLRRLDQFHSHITLTPDWINYALLDDITDSFASPIQTIEYEVDSIDELVLLLRENETSDMLRRIGSCRKNAMTISRLLTNKADVIRGLMKRFDERFVMATAGSAGGSWNQNTSTATVGAMDPNTAPPQQLQQQPYREGEILLYLGDILDHVLTMLQSLNSYEKILARSHSNYLAQISLEINQLSNKTNNVVGTLTFFASLIVPMTFITGLWGMNVHVPGQPGEEDAPLTWWWGLCGFMLLYCIVAVIFGKRYGLI